MEITMDDFTENIFDATHALNMQADVTAYAGPGDDEEGEGEEGEGTGEGPSEDEPALDPDVVHSPVTTQKGGKP